MNREELIEEALHAYHGVEDRGQSWAWSEESVASMRAALAVFEKAHTPTEDEREALRIAHLDARQEAYREDRALWFRDYDNSPEIATNAFFRGWDAAVAGGFRRSEVPEPKGEACCAHPKCPGGSLCCCQNEAEPQGEPSDAQVQQMQDELEYRVRTAAALAKGGHNIDVQVRAGRARIGKLAVALRAAEGVR